jgi:hypothetical protein
MFQTEVTEKIKTHLCSITFFFRKSYRLWDNVEKYGTASQATGDNVIRRMRFACWITKATNTFRICHNFCFSRATLVTRTRLNVTLYVHCLSCYALFSLIGTTVLHSGVICCKWAAKMRKLKACVVWKAETDIYQCFFLEPSKLSICEFKMWRPYTELFNRYAFKC